MSLVCRIKNEGKITGAELNTIVNSVSVDLLSINIFSDGRVDGPNEWGAVPDMFLDHTHWRQSVLFESSFNYKWFKMVDLTKDGTGVKNQKGQVQIKKVLGENKLVTNIDQNRKSPEAGATRTNNREAYLSFSGKKRYKNVSDLLVSSKSKNTPEADLSKLSTFSKGVENLSPSLSHISASSMSRIRRVQFNLDHKKILQEFEFFSYLESQSFMIYFEVFKECVKNNFDIFKHIKQSSVLIKFSLLDLSPKSYKKSWLQLQKLKTRYPFVRLILDVDERTLENPKIMRLFGAENLAGFHFQDIEFKPKRMKRNQFSIKNRVLLMHLLDSLEKGYLVIIDIKSPEKELGKFDLLKKLSSEYLRKLPKTRQQRRERYNSVVEQISELTLDLSAAIYSIYEEDALKYKAFEQAIAEKLLKLQDVNHLTICILGAGRGGLLLALAKALNSLGDVAVSSVKVIEKNTNCKFALKHLVNKHPQCKDLRNKIELILKNAKAVTLEEFGGYPANLVISEMVGCFGCNEQAPDTLHHCRQ